MSQNGEIEKVLDFLANNSPEDIGLLKDIVDYWEREGKNFGYFQYNDIGLPPSKIRKLIKLTETGILKIKFKTAKGGLHYELAINPNLIRQAIQLHKQQPKQQPKPKLDLQEMELTAINAWLLSVYPEALIRRLKRLSLNPERLDYRKDKEFLEVELPIKLDRLLTIAKRIKKCKFENKLGDKLNLINTIFKIAKEKIAQLEANRKHSSKTSQK